MKKIISEKYPLFLMLFSIAFGIVYSIGRQLYETGLLNVSFIEIIISGVLCFICLNVGRYLSYKLSAESSDALQYGWDLELKIFVLLLASYLVCLCTYFPGVGMNDGLNMLNEGMGISKQFPVYYCIFVTLLGKIGYRLGSLQISIALYSICQVFAVSAILAGVIGWFWRKNIRGIFKVCLTLFLVLEPIFPMYAISMLKDTLFALFLAASLIFLYEMIHGNLQMKKEKWFWIFFGIDLAGIVVLRNNGVYIVGILLAVLIILFRVYRKKLLLITGSLCIVLFFGRLVMAQYGQTQLFQEMAGIPLQQIAAVVSEDGYMEKEQEEFVEQIMPLSIIKQKYNPATVDVLKWDHENFNTEFLNEHKAEFLKVWSELLIPNFDIYIKAYLQQTYWFWAPRQEGDVQVFYTIETFADNSWLIEFVEKNGIHDQPLLPESLNSVLRSYYNYGRYFLREGVCFWIMLGCALLLFLKRKNWKEFVIFLPCILLWLTLMISTPVASSMRYVFAFVYGLPIYFVFLLIKDEGQNAEI